MTLLKNNEATLKTKTKRQMSNGVGLSIKDGWYAGIGFGLAMTIAVPIILLLLACIVGIGLSILGSSLGALF